MEPSERDRETAWALWRGSYITEADAIRAIAAALAEERERCAAWHDKEGEFHNNRAKEAKDMNCLLMAQMQQEHAEWHRSAAAAIRALKEPAP